jgi:hypothetical protein
MGRALERAAQVSTDPRYTIFAARAVFDERLTPMDVRVLAALGTFSDRQGWCNPSQTTIAKRIGTARSWVNASIKRLVDAGYVQAVKQYKEGGAQGVSLYRVLMDLSAPDAVVDASSTAEFLALVPVSNTDTPLSAKQTPRHLASVDAKRSQDTGGVSSTADTPLSAATDTPCHLQQTQNIPIEHSQKNKRATRLPATWTPRVDEVEFGKAGGLSEAEVLAAGEHMRDWAEANSKSKANWDLTFRNWLRTAISDAKRGRRPVVSAVASFDRAKALKRYFENDWRHPLLTDDDIANALKAQGAKP